MSDSLWPHGLQHARLLCPSPTPRACSNSFPSSQWCHPTISSSVVPFSCLQYFPASGSFPVSQFFISGGQSIGVSAAASVLPMNIQDWSPLGWTGWISLQSRGLKSLLQHHSSKALILWHSAFFIVQLLFSRKFIILHVLSTSCFPGSLDGKASAYNAGDTGSIPGLGRSPGEGNGKPVQYSCLENPMDPGAWWATVHGVAKSRTRLSDFSSLLLHHSLKHFLCLGISPPKLIHNCPFF